jgi:hypothetical protein
VLELAGIGRSSRRSASRSARRGRSDRLEELLRQARADDARQELQAARGHAHARRQTLLLVGGEGEKRTLPAAVKYTDLVNWQSGPQEFAVRAAYSPSSAKRQVATQQASDGLTPPTSISSTANTSSSAGDSILTAA